MTRFDVIVIGGGPAGERAAIHAARLGKRAALVERDRVVGGTGVNWGAIPSKTLRESALFVRSLTDRKLEGVPCGIQGELTIADFMYRERAVVARELEYINKSLDRHAVELYTGHARLVDAHTVAVTSDGQERLRLTAELIVIATGTRPNRPAEIDFDGEVVFDSASILRLPRMPRSLVVLGAGVIGVEYASIFAALGIQVTLVDTRPQLLPYLDQEISGILERELKKLRVVILHDDHYAQVTKRPGPPPAVVIETRQGNHLEADALLYCVGRDGNSDGMGLAELGVQVSDRGLIQVNESFQTALPNVYAVGDVIGYPALASTAMEQGRQAIRHAFGVSGPRGRMAVLPFAIYAIPEVGTIGATEQELIAEGTDYVVGHGLYRRNPRGQIIGDPGGVLKLIFSRPELRLLGAHLVGSQASELIHIGQAFFYAGATADEIAETLYNYPTLSDLYRHAALEALGRAGRLQYS